MLLGGSAIACTEITDYVRCPHHHQTLRILNDKKIKNLIHRIN
jgi:hypothetical protein